jgi:aspartate-semialdehyde dehydrogenase
MKERAKCTPAQRAAKYLKRVAVLTGAEQVPGDSYWLRAGRRNFLVDSKFVRVISHHGKSTCFSVATDPDIPSAEIVASALLQLKNNPRLFKKWRKQPGYTFKANGKMFRDAYPLTRDET